MVFEHVHGTNTRGLTVTTMDEEAIDDAHWESECTAVLCPKGGMI